MFPGMLPFQSSIDAIGRPGVVAVLHWLTIHHPFHEWSPQLRGAVLGLRIVFFRGLHVDDESIVVPRPLARRFGVRRRIGLRASRSGADVEAVQRGHPDVLQLSGLQERPDGFPPAVALLQHRIEAVGLSLRDPLIPEPCLQVQAAEHGLLVALAESHAVLLHDSELLAGNDVQGRYSELSARTIIRNTYPGIHLIRNGPLEIQPVPHYSELV